MANAAAKRLAAANAKALNTFHQISISIFISAFALFLWRDRPLTKAVILSIPAWIVEYILEKSCRPTYSGRTLVAPGQDFRQSGLTEYMQDVVYWTWICIVFAVLIGNKAWYLYWAIPGFVVYKLWGLLKAGKQLFGGGAAPEAPQSADVAERPSNGTEEQKLSRRQEKRQRLQAKRQPQAYAQAQAKAQAQAQAQAQS